jgi:flavodoxin
MSDVLCIYYSRTGQTKNAMTEIAQALDAELVAVTDGVDRSGFKGYMRSGMDAMRKGTMNLQPFETEKKLEDYRLVIIGTPIWAGRCCSVIRGLLKRRGLELSRVAYVVTRDHDGRYEDIYRQMDGFTAQPHLFGVSLRMESVGYHFWRDRFVQDIKNYLQQ